MVTQRQWQSLILLTRDKDAKVKDSGPVQIQDIEEETEKYKRNCIGHVESHICWLWRFY